MNARATMRMLLLVALTTLAAAATIAFAAPGGIPGKPGGDTGGEETGNNLSFPVLFAEAPLAIPSDSEQGTYSLNGMYLLWDGVNPPCLPGETGCFLDPEADLTRVYIQKDPDNDWQAEWIAGLESLRVDYMDVGDNLESVPWRSTSVVRVEFVPFQDTYMEGVPPLTGFKMVYVDGQGPSEVWGVNATNPAEGEPADAIIESLDLATLYSDTMVLVLTKLEPTAGDINIEPDPDGTNYTWNKDLLAWEQAGTGAPVAYTKVDDISAEINVKGRVIYGYNWRLKEMAPPPGVPTAGWWRLTFVAGHPAIDPERPGLDFTSNTLLFDPTAPVAPEPEAEEPGEGTYPRVPVVLPDDDHELTYIDIYIQASSSGGKGRGNGGGQP